MIYAIGIDILDTAKIAALLQRKPDRLVRWMFSAREQLALQTISVLRLKDYVAGRWAAKEAVLKALGSGIGPIAFPEIEIVANELGQPSVSFDGRASDWVRARGISRWHLSISHDRNYAAAVAIAECNVEPRMP